MENIDPPRERPGAASDQIATLARFGLTSDEPVLFQNSRDGAYENALQHLVVSNHVFRCNCSRGRRTADDPDALSKPYPGTCRDRQVTGPSALRFRVERGTTQFTDRWMGHFEQDVASAVGDFIIRRSDGLWAYQLAVVVDDDFQGITHIVRGADLLDNTPRQILLQQALGLPTPTYLHVPLVTDALGRKLSKQDGDFAPSPAHALDELERAWRHLGFPATGAQDPAEFLRRAVEHWRARWRQNTDAGAAAPRQTAAP
jgi:glutamyl-Q tRNA(Asp) synthetase